MVLSKTSTYRIPHKIVNNVTKLVCDTLLHTVRDDVWNYTIKHINTQVGVHIYDDIWDNLM
jgi:hypothetical protein